MKQKARERGSVLILVVLALGIFLLGAVGLGIDGSRLYAERQMAQAAADASAQAAMMSIFNHTNQMGESTDFEAERELSWDCAGTTPDPRTPCMYALKNSFGAKASDTVSLYYPRPDEVPGIGTLSDDDVNLVRVTVSRVVDTTLMRMLGATATTVRARATAAILQETSPTPILVTHPTMEDALEVDGGPTVVICGGPSRSIQVNSRDPGAWGSGGTVDLSRAGPDDDGYCTTGTGADFSTYGGPSTNDGTVLLGSTGRYLNDSPIEDPYAKVPVPDPALLPAGTTETFPWTADPTHCPMKSTKPCILYRPGVYSQGVNVKNEIAFFAPGVYYMANGKGFEGGPNGDMYMCPVASSLCPSDPAYSGPGVGNHGTGTGWTERMLVYNSGGGRFVVGANGTASLTGSPQDSVYEGILLFQDRNSPAATGSKSHNLGGGGNMSLEGTIYLTNTLDTMLNVDPSQYQALWLHGNPGSTTLIHGDIVVGSLHLAGSSTIRMELWPNAMRFVRRVALVK